MLLLLDLNDGAVLESPLDNVGLLAGALDVLAGAEGRPELAEVLDLDEVPDVGERGADDGRLADRGGGGDGGRHCVKLFGCGSEESSEVFWYKGGRWAGVWLLDFATIFPPHAGFICLSLRARICSYRERHQGDMIKA